MLTSLKQPLKTGKVVPMRLTLERRDRSRFALEVKAEVRESAEGGARKGR